MDLESISALDEEITAEEWGQTPASVKRLLRHVCEDLLERVTALEEDQVLRTLESAEAERRVSGTAAAGIKDSIKCTFCGRRDGDGVKMISGGTVQICSDCVALCNELLADCEVATEREA